MEDWKDLLNDNEVLYAIGSVFAGAYYGIKKFGSKKPVADTQTEIIDILRQHVDDEDERNKSFKSELKEIKLSNEQLEDENLLLKKKLRRYESFNDNLKYYCPYIPSIDEDHANFNFKSCSLQTDCFKLKYCPMEDRRKAQTNSTEFERRSSDLNEKSSDDITNEDFYVNL